MHVVASALHRFLCGVVLCSIVLSLFPEGRMKELLRMFTGIFLSVILLSSIPSVKLPDFEGIKEDYLQQAQTAAADGENYTRQQYLKFIKQQLEAYILDIAHRNGCALTVRVEVDGDGYPVSVALWGNVSSDERKALEVIISEELGIAKEDQQWNGLQTRKRSAHS